MSTLRYLTERSKGRLPVEVGIECLGTTTITFTVQYWQETLLVDVMMVGPQGTKVITVALTRIYCLGRIHDSHLLVGNKVSTPLARDTFSPLISIPLARDIVLFLHPSLCL